MPTVSNNQKQSLARDFRANWNVEHVQKHFPSHCEALGAGVSDAVRSAMEAAERHGFTAQKDESLFVDLTFMFGEKFLEMSWAIPFVKDDSIPPEERMEAIYSAAIDFLNDEEADVEETEEEETD